MRRAVFFGAVGVVGVFAVGCLDSTTAECGESGLVCGADGVTYENACGAEAAKTPVVAAGKCTEACACEAGGPAVCGEDETTYASQCLADCAGAVVDYAGPCLGECAAISCDLDCGDRGTMTGADGCPLCACNPPVECDCVAGQRCVEGTCIDIGCEDSDKVDLLFVVDNSNSMAEEQASLAAQFERMALALTTGDTDGDGRADMAPVRNLNVGVITTDMGTGGFRVPTCERPEFGEDGVLRTTGNTALPGATCQASYPSFLNFTARGDEPVDGAATGLAQDLRCMAMVGTGGCGFEQPLEAMLKAVTDTEAPLTFARDTRGHSGIGGLNAGFLRPDSILSIVMVTDEEDCSAEDAEIYNPSSAVYTEDLNLRCFFHKDRALHPVRRYIDGLLEARAPGRLVFTLIGGVPVDLVSSPGTTDFDQLLSDARMQETPDPVAQTPRLVPSCIDPDRGIAFPPRRMVELARGLNERGAAATVQSICQADFRPALDTTIRTIASRVAGECE